MLAGCADQSVQRPPDPRVERPVERSYVVRSGDTLYSIAWRHGLDYRELARWNGIGADFRISPGQALRLSPPQRALSSKRAINAAATPAPSASLPTSPSTSPSPGPSAAGAAAALSWMWPTEPNGAPLPVSGGGVLLQGRLGQDVRAAGAGRVVYAGTGIRGYGNLIIIKHGEVFLSAYAHNSESLVREGQEVALGQVIGKMGEGAPHKAALYFEIRRNGKPVDPLRFLPSLK